MHGNISMKRRFAHTIVSVVAILTTLGLGCSTSLAFAHFKSSSGWVTSCGCTYRLGTSTSFNWNGNLVVIHCKSAAQMCWVIDGADLYILDIGGTDPDVTDQATGTGVERIE